MSVYASGPSLSHDILLELFRHIPRQSDVAALMSTRKALWKGGLRVLLAHGTVVRTPAALRSFCAFMYTDISARAPLLRQLHVKLSVEHYPDTRSTDSDDSDDTEPHPGQGNTCVSREDVAILTRILEKATNLEDLCMDWCDELLALDDEASLSTAVVNLEHLRRLRVGSIGPVVVEVLNLGRSPLVELDLDCYVESKRSMLRILHLAAPYAPTLEKLTARHGQIMGVYADDVSEDILVFPRVRALALRDVDDLHSVAVLHHAFPALRSLEFSTRENDIDTEEMRRDTARDAFAHPWGVLDRLCGAAESLYALGGAPRARLLEVYRVHSHPVLLSQLREVVLDTEPTQLVLHLGRGYSDISPNFFARDISNLVSFRSRTVAHLVLNMSVGCLGGSGEEFLSALGTLLRTQQIKFLVLRFLQRQVLDHGIDGVAEERGGEIGAESKPLKDNEVVEAMTSSPFENVLRRLYDSDPALANVVLDIEGRGCEHWTLRRAGGGLLTQLLDDATGCALVHAEGLGLTDGKI
ncbi:hypothetical protein C2E23DRAFT_243886 [Lenzites betulinus]|nr:hypothetical protein C2E23DRAFT_243886 [Lenzites betulinus]